MNRKTVSNGLALAVLVVGALALGGSADAQSLIIGLTGKLEVGGFSDGSQYPERFEIAVPIETDNLGGWNEFFISYLGRRLGKPEPEPVGKSVVVIKVLRPDGSRKRLGRLVIRQRESGLVFGQKSFELSLGRGDAVVFSVRNKRFGPLAEFEVLLLEARVSPFELTVLS